MSHFQREGLSYKLKVKIVKSKALLYNNLFKRFARYRFNKKKYNGFRILFSNKDLWDDNIRNNFSDLGVFCDFQSFSYRVFNQYDLVIPLNIEDLQKCCEHRDMLTNQLIPIPSKESINICNNKKTFCRTMHQLGYARYLPGYTYSFPYVLKKDLGEFGQTTFIIKTEKDESKYQHELSDPDFFKQQLIKGKKEYTTHIIIRNKKIVSAINICYTFPNEIFVKNDETIYLSKQIVTNRFLPLFENILNAIGYEGLCCFNYKIVEEEPIIFEINPRFGGSLSEYFFAMLEKL